MLLQIEKSVKAEVVEEQILSAIPEWDLRPGYVIIGTYGSVEKQEQDLLQSVGSPTSDIPYGSEFRFAKDNLLLKRIWVNAPEENLESSEMIEGWLNLKPVPGLLRLLSPEMFDDKKSDYRWMSPDGKLLAAIEDTDTICSDDKFRLRVAQDFDLLFAEQKWCGWLLSNPTRYLAKPNLEADLDTELPLLALEYISLVCDSNFDFLLDADTEFLQQLFGLRDKINLNKGAIKHRQIIYNATEEIIERFYGNKVLAR